MLGHAWYTHWEQGEAQRYFEQAQEADALLQRVLPDFQATFLGLLRRLLQAEVTQRSGWCGPGVHIFPAGAQVARRGGVIHFDTEGLSEAHVESGAPALSWVLMLQPAAQGGGLRLWKHRFRGGNVRQREKLPIERAHRNKERVVVPYDVGDLLCFESYRLHQIEPFQGPLDRISGTAHSAWFRGAWETWF